MELKTFIIVIFLASFIHHYDCILKDTLFFSVYNKLQNPSLLCPKTPKTLYPGTSSSAIQTVTESANNGKPENSIDVMHSRAFKLKRDPRAFRNLDITLLPSNEVCVLGKKLPNIILPQNYQYQIMTGITFWLSPCISIPNPAKSNDCIERKLNVMELVDIDAFRTFAFYTVHFTYRVQYLNVTVIYILQ